MSLPLITEQPLSLLDMPRGCTLYVEELAGSPSLRSKLYSMGILPGTEMELCRGGCGKGSVCVRVRQSSLVLGESMAQAIYCRPAEGYGQHRRHHHHRHGSKDSLDANACSCSNIANQPQLMWAGSNADGAKKDNNA